ncbi:hypothetical protein [Bradyrhizobium sp. DASA03120]|uniref:hypothetical protein n=1 Tax=Bradyrhizobium sp. SMVTL-02 TaxID=3395917 RepID=UPI003F703FF9
MSKISNPALQVSHVDSALTVSQFCRAESLSKSTYYSLRRRGLGPEERVVPGTRIIRITAEARTAWRERMAEFARSGAAQLEAERRRELASMAGQIAARSPKHFSRRRSPVGQYLQKTPRRGSNVIGICRDDE